MANIILKVWTFYYEGFKSMTLGKTLWIIILAKLFVMFFILRLFFFPNLLNRLPDESAKENFVSSELIDRSTIHTDQ